MRVLDDYIPVLHNKSEQKPQKDQPCGFKRPLVTLISATGLSL